VFADPYQHKEVAARGAGVAGLALAVEADAHAGVHAGWDGHLECALDVHPAVAVTVRARVGDDCAAAAAAWAGPLYLEEPLPLDDNSLAVAPTASGRPA